VGRRARRWGRSPPRGPILVFGRAAGRAPAAVVVRLRYSSDSHGRAAALSLTTPRCEPAPGEVRGASPVIAVTSRSNLYVGSWWTRLLERAHAQSTPPADAAAVGNRRAAHRQGGSNATCARTRAILAAQKYRGHIARPSITPIRGPLTRVWAPRSLGFWPHGCSSRPLHEANKLPVN
jgi:hypothetical protein